MTSPKPLRSLGRTRLALAGGAALLVAACGDPEPVSDEANGSGGETVTETDTATDTAVTDTTGTVTDTTVTATDTTVITQTQQTDSEADPEVPNGEVGHEVELQQQEVSCAGRCGSHHHPPCMDDPDPCPAPPYGAPPLDDTLV